MSAEIFTPEQVAERFQLTRAQVMRFVSKGAWPCLRISQKNIRFTQEHIEQIEMLSKVEVSAPANRNFGRITKGAL